MKNYCSKLTLKAFEHNISMALSGEEKMFFNLLLEPLERI
jgi:hypothetical protein